MSALWEGPVSIVELAEGFSRAAKADQVAEDHLLVVVDTLYNATREEAPKMTYELVMGIQRIQKGNLAWDISEVGTKHGVYIREKTVGHSIYPSIKKALWWPGLSHPIGFVPHPGIKKANLYHQRAFNKNRRSVMDHLRAMGKSIVMYIKRPDPPAKPNVQVTNYYY